MNCNHDVIKSIFDMNVTIKVIQTETPLLSQTEILQTVYGEFDSDRSLSEFFVTFLPFLSGRLAEACINGDGISRRTIKIVVEYGDKDISELRDAVS